jgi:hypothetical protein
MVRLTSNRCGLRVSHLTGGCLVTSPAISVRDLSLDSLGPIPLVASRSACLGLAGCRRKEFDRCTNFVVGQSSSYSISDTAASIAPSSFRRLARSLMPSRRPDSKSSPSVPISRSILKRASEGLEQPLPFPLVADPEMKIFREYRCYDDFEKAALHGTFIVDSQGKDSLAGHQLRSVYGCRFPAEGGQAVALH